MSWGDYGSVQDEHIPCDAGLLFFQSDIADHKHQLNGIRHAEVTIRFVGVGPQHVHAHPLGGETWQRRNVPENSGTRGTSLFPYAGTERI